MNEKTKSVLPAIFASVFVPGLGHFMQKQIGAAFDYFVFLGVSI